MRVSFFTRLLAILLTLASVLLAATLLWASHTLLKIQQQDIAYSQLKNTIMVDLAGLLEDYLARGNSQSFFAFGLIFNHFFREFLSDIIPFNQSIDLYFLITVNY